MVSRVVIAMVFCGIAGATAIGQVVRFETSVGDFDMVLNPTNNPLLQIHADNMLQYIEDDRYKRSWINRAPENFVLQMGGLFSHTKRPPLTVDSTRPVVTFDPVPGEPASDIGLSNTVGTVALALPSDNLGNPFQDAGTSSFFINLASNTFLDPNFTVFAAIPDMTTVNRIMALMQVDLSQSSMFGSGGATFSDVPVQANGFQVFIERAFVVQDALEVARARGGVQSTMALSTTSGSESPSSFPALTTGVVPEPASCVLFVLAATGTLALCPRASRRR